MTIYYVVLSTEFLHKMHLVVAENTKAAIEQACILEHIKPIDVFAWVFTSQPEAVSEYGRSTS